MPAARATAPRLAGSRHTGSGSPLEAVLSGGFRPGSGVKGLKRSQTETGGHMVGCGLEMGLWFGLSAPTAAADLPLGFTSHRLHQCSGAGVFGLGPAVDSIVRARHDGRTRMV